MDHQQKAKADAFRALHQSGDLFLMPNAWDPGTARLLASAGFPAIGTTSAGIAFSFGLPDNGRIGRDDMLDGVRRIAEAVDLPVNADLENGYGATPDEVAETIRRAIAAGAVGGNIEDLSGDRAAPLYEPGVAAERIEAARAAADASGIAFTLTARVDCYLSRHPEAFAESVRRANLYRGAGADCLFVPGVADAAKIGALVREIDGPLNVVMGLAGSPLTAAELRDLGVRRISIGGSLARATLALVRRAADEMARDGTFGFAHDQIPQRELNGFFAEWEGRRL